MSYLLTFSSCITSATVAWEFTGSWADGIKHYFPRYGAKGIVRSLFATNVP